MRLNELVLHNFRQHEKTRIALRKGITVLLGENGAGKTTLLEGIAWIIFGMKAARGLKEDIRYWGAPKGGKVMGDLDFTLMGDRYIFHRTLTDASATRNGDTVATGDSGVTEFAVKLFGMTRDEFYNTYFTAQDKLKFLGDVKEGVARGRFINKMLRYDVVERAQQLGREQRTKLQANLTTLQRFTGGVSAAETLLATANEHLEAVRAEGKEAYTALQELEEQYAAAKQAEHDALERRRTIEAAKDRLRALDLAVERAEADVRNIQADLDDALRAQQELADYPISDTRPLEQKIAELSRRYTLEAKKAANEKAYRLDARLKALDARHEWLRGADDGKCEYCGGPMTLEQIEVEIGAVELEWSQVSGELATAEHELREQEQGAGEIADATADLRTMTQDNERNAREVAKRQGDVADIPDLTRKLEAAKRALENARDEYSQAMDDYPDGADLIDEQFDEARSHREDVEEYVTKKRVLVAQLQGNYVAAKSARDFAAQELEIARAREEEVAALRQRILLYDEMDAALSDARDALNDRVRPELAATASEIISDITDGYWTGVQLTEDFGVQVLQGNTVRGVVSGGEDDMVNLALRIAATEMHAARSGVQIAVLVLDEVFASFSTTTRANTMQVLDRLRNRYDQTLIITHVEDVADYADSVLRFVRNPVTGASRVTDASAAA